METRLLIVEDEPEMLMFLKRFFLRKGYAVTAVASGEEAWGALIETEFDLVISDLVLEGMSGMELLTKIRAIDRDLPFIITMSPSPSSARIWKSWPSGRWSSA
jgi:DNA-binding response OmpR family regulator